MTDTKLNEVIDKSKAWATTHHVVLAAIGGFIAGIVARSIF